MTFLKRYWYAVERAVSETGSNPGDVVVDLTQLNNTEPTNDVVDTTPVTTPTETIKPKTIHPEKGGSMPCYRTDFAAKEILARRSARPSETIERMETAFEQTSKTKKSRPRDFQSEDDRRSDIGNTSKKAIRAERTRKRKALKRLGGGRKVRVVIDEVTLNGSSIWKACETH